MLHTTSSSCSKIFTKNSAGNVKIGTKLSENINILPWGGGVLLPIVPVGKNQKTPFLKTDNLADTLFFDKNNVFFGEKNCLLR